ncbi:UNVERIFIED_CONTAM: hypothetical protein HDU68_007492 [Siphonaria sp. JEL0065]|nr:hypothetical protein HDU68_007492 [Siphonaria sp. JEL0065]
MTPCSQCATVFEENQILTAEVENLRSRIKVLDRVVAGISVLEDSFNSLVEKLVSGGNIQETESGRDYKQVDIGGNTGRGRGDDGVGSSDDNPKYPSATPTLRCTHPGCRRTFSSEAQRDYHDWNLHATYCAVTFLNQHIARHVFRNQRDKLFHCLCGFTTDQCKLLQEHGSTRCDGSSSNTHIPTPSPLKRLQIPVLRALCDDEDCDSDGGRLGNFSAEERALHQTERHGDPIVCFPLWDNVSFKVKRRIDGSLVCGCCKNAVFETTSKLLIHAKSCAPSPDASASPASVLKPSTSATTFSTIDTPEPNNPDSANIRNIRKRKRVSAVIEPPSKSKSTPQQRSSLSLGSNNTLAAVSTSPSKKSAETPNELTAPCGYEGCTTQVPTDARKSYNHRWSFHNNSYRLTYLNQTEESIITRDPVTQELICPCQQFRTMNAYGLRDHSKKCFGVAVSHASTKPKSRLFVATTAAGASSSSSTPNPKPAAKTSSRLSSNVKKEPFFCSVVGCNAKAATLPALQTHNWAYHAPKGKVRYMNSSTDSLIDRDPESQIFRCMCGELETQSLYTIRDHAKKCLGKPYVDMDAFGAVNGVEPDDQANAQDNNIDVEDGGVAVSESEEEVYVEVEVDEWGNETELRELGRVDQNGEVQYHNLEDAVGDSSMDNENGLGGGGVDDGEDDELETLDLLAPTHGKYVDASKIPEGMIPSVFSDNSPNMEGYCTWLDLCICFFPTANMEEIKIKVNEFRKTERIPLLRLMPFYADRMETPKELACIPRSLHEKLVKKLRKWLEKKQLLSSDGSPLRNSDDGEGKKIQI